jgi:hypothetical protein
LRIDPKSTSWEGVCEKAHCPPVQTFDETKSSKIERLVRITANISKLGDNKFHFSTLGATLPHTHKGKLAVE